MSSNTSGSLPGGDLDLEHAEFEEEEATEIQCRSCGVKIPDFYFTLGDAILCERCRLESEAQRAEGSGLARFSRAGLFGLLAAATGAGLWALVAHLTGYEIGIVAIVVGWLVGTAVRIGSGARGGVGYQLLAVFLTYLAIVSTYTPYVIDGFRQAAEGEASEQAASSLDSGDAMTAEGPAGEALVLAEPAGEEVYAEPADTLELSGGEWAAGFVAFALIVLAIAAAAPFLAGAQNLIGILIIGIALWEAWRLNRRVELVFAGPFEVGKELQSAS